MTHPTHKNTLLAGADPGLKGGFALIQVNPWKIMVSLGWDLTKKSGRDRLARSDILAILSASLTDYKQQTDILCAFEDTHSHPSQGISSAFGFGYSSGLLEAFLVGQGFRIIRVSPAKWKRHLGLTAGKAESLRRASLLLGKKLRHKDHDQAEALLLAIWLLWDLAHKEVSPQTHGKFGLLS